MIASVPLARSLCIAASHVTRSLSCADLWALPLASLVSPRSLPNRQAAPCRAPPPPPPPLPTTYDSTCITAGGSSSPLPAGSLAPHCTALKPHVANRHHHRTRISTAPARLYAGGIPTLFIDPSSRRSTILFRSGIDLMLRVMLGRGLAAF
ncbi:uncharacterized protein J3D65DRAFT_643033 [Phyllosticta citribraziliensis]|uniref:Uncharacterized protein n=1 Tax=Phyllosticta citribraziliensis TaxID=989973 RepID=A0ABR1L239_9PEZI